MTAYKVGANQTTQRIIRTNIDDSTTVTSGKGLLMEV